MKQCNSGVKSLALEPEDYLAWRATVLGKMTERLEWQLMLEMLGDVRGRRILDLGCGDGAFSIELWQRGAKVVGIDTSASMIVAARSAAAKCGADISFCLASAADIPFEARQFDRVVALTVLCFIADATPTYREVARLLRPEGCLVIGELGRWSSWAATRRIRASLGSPL